VQESVQESWALVALLSAVPVVQYWFASHSQDATPEACSLRFCCEVSLANFAEQLPVT
jgi:hypothetical protein